jgi:hypothetical protein
MNVSTSFLARAFDRIEGCLDDPEESRMNTSHLIKLVLAALVGLAFTTDRASAQYDEEREGPRGGAGGSVQQAQTQLRAAEQKLNQTRNRLYNQMI